MAVWGRERYRGPRALELTDARDKMGGVVNGLSDTPMLIYR